MLARRRRASQSQEGEQAPMQETEETGKRKGRSIKLALVMAVVALGWYVVSMIVIWNQ
jgi:hypothetical protein